jgi:hypothetical protein
MAPGKEAGKDGGKTEVEKRCGYLASATLLVEFLFHCFLPGNTENDRAKNWKGHASSRLNRGDANDALPLWHSCIFVSFWRISLACSDPARRNWALTKRKRL